LQPKVHPKHGPDQQSIWQLAQVHHQSLWQAHHQLALTASDKENKCNSVAGNFDSHGGAPEQYEAHCSMQHVQGYTGSHWTLSSGNYSLRIAPVAAMVTNNKTTMKHTPHLLAILMTITMWRYDTERIAQ
jgi:hypothetical protein